MPTIDELAAYITRQSIGVSCKDAHLVWAIQLGIDAGDWSYVCRVSQMRRSLGRLAA